MTIEENDHEIRLCIQISCVIINILLSQRDFKLVVYLYEQVSGGFGGSVMFTYTITYFVIKHHIFCT